MKILSAKQVSEMTSLSVPQIRRMANSGTMPSPIQISGSRVGWIEEELETWLLNISNTNAKGESNES